MEEFKAKFQLSDILAIGLTLVIAGIGLSYGIEVMGDIRDDQTANSLERNATEDAMSGVAKLPEKMPLIATVAVAAIIIGVLIRYLAANYMK